MITDVILVKLSVPKTILLPHFTERVVFLIFAAVFVSLRSILLVELLGLEMLTKSFGILILFQGIATMVGAPVAGELVNGWHS